MNYITYAVTAEDLRAEVVKELKRRMEHIKGEAKTVPFTKINEARTKSALYELSVQLNLWETILILKQEDNINAL